MLEVQDSISPEVLRRVFDAFGAEYDLDDKRPGSYSIFFPSSGLHAYCDAGKHHLTAEDFPDERWRTGACVGFAPLNSEYAKSCNELESIVRLLAASTTGNFVFTWQFETTHASKIDGVFRWLLPLTNVS